MAVPLPTYRSTSHAPITRIGALVIAPNGVPRRMLAVCRNAFEDISGCISESRKHDAEHDAALVNAERNALRGIELAHQVGAPAGRLQSILDDIRTAQAADELEDDCVIRAWVHAKRLAGCIRKLFVARRGAGKDGR
jgi:hypothetical protein